MNQSILNRHVKERLQSRDEYHEEYQYLDLLRMVMMHGEIHHNRTGIDTRSLWCPPALRFDIEDGKNFPLYTTRKCYLKPVLGELFFFLSGSDKLQDLHDLGVYFWDANVNDPLWKQNPHYVEGSLGRSYGSQWRNFCIGHIQGVSVAVDQINRLLDNLLTDPYSRRHIVSAWHPGDVHKTCLPACHVMFQVKVHDEEYISLVFTMRSNDLGLGNPANVASYAALLLMLARHCGRKAKYLICEMHDAHIYENHLESLVKQTLRKPYPFPSVSLDIKPFWSYNVHDFMLNNYTHHPAIKMEMVV